MQGGTAGVTLPAHLQAAVKGATGPGAAGKGELSWLMRTTYISNDVAERRQQGVSEKKAKAMRQVQQEAPADSREAQIDAIEATFEAAQLPPVHQTKPDMKAMKVLPGQILHTVHVWLYETRNYFSMIQTRYECFVSSHASQRSSQCALQPDVLLTI